MIFLNKLKMNEGVGGNYFLKQNPHVWDLPVDSTVVKHTETFLKQTNKSNTHTSMHARLRQGAHEDCSEMIV